MLEPKLFNLTSEFGTNANNYLNYLKGDQFYIFINLKQKKVMIFNKESLNGIKIL